MLIELAPVGVQCAEDADIDDLFARVAEHGAGSAAKQVDELRPVFVEERSGKMRHGESDVLPVRVGQYVPLLGAFEAATAAGFGLATLTEEARMGTVRGNCSQYGSIALRYRQKNIIINIYMKYPSATEPNRDPHPCENMP
uniref:hypothetical protein n=1 Tax=Serratia quinivorans TaxID=137545 RepID=UPI001CB8CB86|nr:hypothetical protein [Serratia quinivorans]